MSVNGWTISLQEKRCHEVDRKMVYRWMLRITSMDHVNNEDVLKNIRTRRKLRLIKRETIGTSGIHNRERGLANVTLKRHLEGDRGLGKYGITCLTSLCKWVANQRLRGMLKRQTLHGDTNDEKLWRVIIAHAR